MTDEPRKQEAGRDGGEVTGRDGGEVTGRGMDDEDGRGIEGDRPSGKSKAAGNS